MTEDEILSRLKKVLLLDKETILTKVGGNFFSSLGIPNYAWCNERVMHTLISQTRRIMRITRCQNKQVLEIGSGSGFHSIIMALSGVRKLTAFDYNKDYIIMLRNMIRIINEPELYAKLQGDYPIEVLVSADSDWSKNTEPLVFTSLYGKGRCVHNALGHDHKAILHDSMKQLIRRGVEWAATGKVKE